MAGNSDNAAPRSLDDMLKESREKRKAEQLAQEIFGRRSKTPATAKAKPVLGASLASRVGVSKRPSSLPRTNSAPARNGRQAPAYPSRPPGREDTHRPKATYLQQTAPSDLGIEAKSNGYTAYDAVAAANGAGGGVSIRGAAAVPHVVVASNFAPGTTAADIESVMLDVGGQMTDCRLVASTPTVIAEMIFVEKSGAEMVINTFNNKKADGRTLHVYWKLSGIGSKGSELEAVPVEAVEDTMEVDENAQSREAENRLREERRGRPDREPRAAFPTGPKGDRGYEEDYYRGPRRAEPPYQEDRYGFDGGYGPRGRYRDEGRMYSDNMRRGGGGRGWR